MTSYYGASSAIMNVQLQVQEICAAFTDTEILTFSGSTVTVDFGQAVQEIRTASFFDNSAATAAPIVASNQSYTPGTSTTVTFTLSAPMAANDALTVRYIVTN